MYKMATITFLLILFSTAQVCAYDGPHHNTLIGRAVGYSKLDNYLKERIGMKEGIEFVIKDDKSVSDCIQEGGEREDDGQYGPMTDDNEFNFTRTTRGWCHFHDPLEEMWEFAGLDDDWAIAYYNSIYSRVSPASSLFWALDSSQRKDYHQYGWTGDWSWNKAREYYYKAIVGDPLGDPPMPRDDAWANCFRAVGQLMHLVQDASVPDHTRNDPHVKDDYERYLKDVVKLDSAYYAGFEPVYPNDIVLTDPNPEFTRFPAVSGLFDRNQYHRGDPIPSNSNDLGLAEFSNANFFSNDTIFKDYPHPSPDDVQYYSPDVWQLEPVVAEDGTAEYRYYLRKTTGEPINRLAAKAYLYDYSLGAPKVMGATLLLDKFCFESYAQKLVPRAIGYSAKLLDYFFRGELEITAPNKFLYGIADGSEPVHQFTQIKANVRNVTPDEQTGTGTLVAVAKYKLRPDYQNDMSNDPPAGPPQVPFSYSTSAEVSAGLLNSTTPTPFTFDFTLDPIPAGVTDLQLYVIFKGTLGLEKGTAVAVGSIDLYEPTHLFVMNAYDLIFLNYQITSTQQILSPGYESLLAMVDLDNDHILCEHDDYVTEPQICQFSVNAKLALYPRNGLIPGVFQASWDFLPPGRFGEILFLSDSPTANMLVYFDLNGNTQPFGNYGAVVYSAVYEGDSSNWQASPVGEFRGVRTHNGFVVNNSHPNDEGYFLAHWWLHPLAELTPIPATQVDLEGVVQ